jgi:chromosomal replication initiator protein
MAILRSKAERAGRTVEPEYLEIIARRVQSNIRELEGALTRLLAFSDLSGLAITRDLVESTLIDLQTRSTAMTPDRIIAAVAEHFGVDEDRLLSTDRSRQVALPRQVAMFLIRQGTDASLPKIGEVLGGRDHTTVMYGLDKIASLLETDEGLRRRVAAIREELYNDSRSNA